MRVVLVRLLSQKSYYTRCTIWIMELCTAQVSLIQLRERLLVSFRGWGSQKRVQKILFHDMKLQRGANSTNVSNLRNPPPHITIPNDRAFQHQLLSGWPDIKRFYAGYMLNISSHTIIFVFRSERFWVTECINHEVAHSDFTRADHSGASTAPRGLAKDLS